MYRRESDAESQKTKTVMKRLYVLTFATYLSDRFQVPVCNIAIYYMAEVGTCSRATRGEPRNWR